MKTFIGWERIFFILLPVALVACSPASSSPEQISEQLVTVEDYKRAEQFLAVNTSKIVMTLLSMSIGRRMKGLFTRNQRHKDIIISWSI